MRTLPSLVVGATSSTVTAATLIALLLQCSSDRECCQPDVSTARRPLRFGLDFLPVRDELFGGQMLQVLVQTNYLEARCYKSWYRRIIWWPDATSLGIDELFGGQMLHVLAQTNYLIARCYKSWYRRIIWWPDATSLGRDDLFGPQMLQFLAQTNYLVARFCNSWHRRSIWSPDATSLGTDKSSAREPAPLSSINSQ